MGDSVDRVIGLFTDCHGVDLLAELVESVVEVGVADRGLFEFVEGYYCKGLSGISTAPPYFAHPNRFARRGLYQNTSTAGC